MQEKSDLRQGTLDLLILKVVALGPVHGYAIAQRLRRARSIRRCTGSKTVAFSLRTGRKRRAGVRRSFIASLGKGGRNPKRKLRAGGD